MNPLPVVVGCTVVCVVCLLGTIRSIRKGRVMISEEKTKLSGVLEEASDFLQEAAIAARA